MKLRAYVLDELKKKQLFLEEINTNCQFGSFYRKDKAELLRRIKNVIIDNLTLKDIDLLFKELRWAEHDFSTTFCPSCKQNKKEVIVIVNIYDEYTSYSICEDCLTKAKNIFEEYRSKVK